MNPDEPAVVPTPAQCLQFMVQEAGSQKVVARRLGVSQSYICDVLSGRREVSASLARKLGYQRYVGYLLLPEQDAEADTRNG